MKLDTEPNKSFDYTFPEVYDNGSWVGTEYHSPERYHIDSGGYFELGGPGAGRMDGRFRFYYHGRLHTWENGQYERGRGTVGEFFIRIPNLHDRKTRAILKLTYGTPNLTIAAVADLVFKYIDGKAFTQLPENMPRHLYIV